MILTVCRWVVYQSAATQPAKICIQYTFSERLVDCGKLLSPAEPTSWSVLQPCRWLWTSPCHRRESDEVALSAGNTPKWGASLWVVMSENRTCQGYCTSLYIVMLCCECLPDDFDGETSIEFWDFPAGHLWLPEGNVVLRLVLRPQERCQTVALQRAVGNGSATLLAAQMSNPSRWDLKDRGW